MADQPDAVPQTNELRRFRLRRDRVLLGLLAFEAFLLLSDRLHWFTNKENQPLTVLLACGGIAAPFIPSLARLAAAGVRRCWLAVASFFRGRRWYQFSLGSLLVFTLLFALIVGWLGKRIEQKRPVFHAVEATGEAEGQVWFYQARRQSRWPEQAIRAAMVAKRARRELFQRGPGG